MDEPLTVDAARARAAIAHAVLRSGGEDAVLGDITLLPHQRAAVGRLRRVLQESGGALLADSVGLGKTYVAAALIRDARTPLVIAPAALRAMWREAFRRTGASATLTTYAALSRGRGPDGAFDLLVLDEAHHARNPATRRYRRLAALAADARVLLLSATPVHNSRRDLGALLALFLGARALQSSDADLARFIVRREHTDVPSAELPRALAPRWLHVSNDERTPEMILALPPPLPPSDGGDGGALVAWTLLRQWASSTGALVAALRRRLARAAALSAALDQGRHLSRADLALWACGDGAVQLALPGLLAGEPAASGALATAVAGHAEALRGLLAHARSIPDSDHERVQHLAALRAAHSGEKIVAFSQFADTIDGLFRLLRHAPGVAALTGSRARVAGGPLSRREAIARFAPHATGTHPPRAAERIDLLLTTDLLSEGINLQDASVVVHLDLPWTGARLEQRVGRSCRLGARHERTAVYAFAPPASAETPLRVKRRLRDKLRAAGLIVGSSDALGNAMISAGQGASATHINEEILRALAQWVDRHPGESHRNPGESRGPPDASRHPGASRRHPGESRGPMDSGVRRNYDIATSRHPGESRGIVSAVHTSRPVLLALVRDGDREHLIAALDADPLSEDSAVVLAAVHLLAGAEDTAPVVLGPALDRVADWIAKRGAATACGVESAPISIATRSRRAAIHRIAAIAARAPQHRRPLLAALATGARRAATAPYGVGAETVLGQLAAAPMSDEAWLRALAAFGDAHRRPTSSGAPGDTPRAVVVIAGEPRPGKPR